LLLFQFQVKNALIFDLELECEGRMSRRNAKHFKRKMRQSNFTFKLLWRRGGCTAASP
jgi:hypothetical protein